MCFLVLMFPILVVLLNCEKLITQNIVDVKVVSKIRRKRRRRRRWRNNFKKK